MLRKRIKIHRLSKTKKYIIILFLCMLSITFAFSFGRYVYTKVIDLYFMTKNFYFESDKLKNPQATYSMNYWNGVDYYDIDIIPIDIFNENIVKVFILTTDYDLTYFMWRGAISWLYSEMSRKYIEDLGYEFEIVKEQPWGFISDTSVQCRVKK